MRLRLRIDLQDDASVNLGTVRITFAPFVAVDAQITFDTLRRKMNGPEMLRRLNMLQEIAEAEIVVSSVPDITIP